MGSQGLWCVSSLQPLFTAAVSGLGPLKGCPSEGCPSVEYSFANTWFPWPHSGSQGDNSDDDQHSRHPGWSEGDERIGQSRTWPSPVFSPRVGGGGTDLAIGTAAPAPSFIWAAGLVIVTEASSSTCHIPHIHSRAEGQASSRVGRIHFLLTGSGLHIAGVPSWAAMLAILTAHGLG